VLKEAFDLPLAEIAAMLDTSVGAVKSALHRGRERTAAAPAALRGNAPSPALLDAFVTAFNARDVGALTALLLDTASIEVQGVGGGRGNRGDWAENSIRYARGRLEARDLNGQPVILHLFDDGAATILDAVTRLEEQDGRISRAQSYPYTPETIAVVADHFGLTPRPAAYHQAPEVLERMIASTGLPWVG
jgi:RNA polymerase sigma-70 factor (ECF subfamily)